MRQMRLAPGQLRSRREGDRPHGDEAGLEAAVALVDLLGAHQVGRINSPIGEARRAGDS
jgi:hypothetical protein